MSNLLQFLRENHVNYHNADAVDVSPSNEQIQSLAQQYSQTIPVAQSSEQLNAAPNENPEGVTETSIHTQSVTPLAPRVDVRQDNVQPRRAFISFTRGNVFPEDQAASLPGAFPIIFPSGLGLILQFRTGYITLEQAIAHFLTLPLNPHVDYTPLLAALHSILLFERLRNHITFSMLMSYRLANQILRATPEEVHAALQERERAGRVGGPMSSSQGQAGYNLLRLT